MKNMPVMLSYTLKERAKKHDLERKMMNLKMMVYKSYGLRLI